MECTLLPQEPLALLEEAERIEERQRKILDLSEELQQAYFHLLTRVP